MIGLECEYTIVYKKCRINFTGERELVEWTAMQSTSTFRAESMNISLLIAGRRGARGKRGHKEAIMSRNMLKLTEANQSSHAKANAGRKKRKRKRSVIETEEPRLLRLRLEQVKEPQNSAIKKADCQSSHSVNKREVKHTRYVVELVGHQTVRFEKEAGWQERRQTREKEALKATKRKLQKQISESDGQTERLEMEEGRQQKEVKFSAEQQAVHSKKKTKLGKRRSK